MAVNNGQHKTFSILAKKILQDLKIGDSILLNGVCLTVTERGRNHFTVDAVVESLMLSNLSELNIGKRVNLERALPVMGRLGGHLVSGHVDVTGVLKGKIDRGSHFEYEIEFPQEFNPYLVHKGSIAIDGVSLTVSHFEMDRFRVQIVPHTLKVTTLNEKNIGEKLNLEFDVLGKYVEGFLFNEKPAGVTEEMMQRVGFIPIGIVNN